MDENKETNVSDHVADSPATDQVKSEKKYQSKEVVRHVDNSSISSLDLFNPEQLVAAKNFLTEIMRSDKGGIKSVNEGLAVLMRAKDLNLPFSTCIEHIHVINGKTGVDIHIVKALLSRAGCTWRIVKDYQPLYEYTDGINVYVDGSFPDYVIRCKSKAEAEAKVSEDKSGDYHYIYPVLWYKDFKGNVYRDYLINTDKMGIAINQAQVEYVTKQNKLPITRIPNVPVDYVTEYELTRNLRGKEIVATGKFSYSEAQKADLLTKDTYAKYAKVLIGHRAFTYAAREIASDILFGVMETTELKIVSGVELSGKDFGSVEDAEVEVLD